MPKAIDITGRSFNDLTAIRFIESRRSADGHMRRTYLFRCICGVEKELPSIMVVGGNTKSCGCRRQRNTSSITHGHCCGGWSVEYQTWASMIRRCHTPGASGFVKYGAKGTTVCQRWRGSFEAFLADLGPRPSDTHSIDRIDPWGHYEPNNVRWATREEQARNKRSHHRKPS